MWKRGGRVLMVRIGPDNNGQKDIQKSGFSFKVTEMSAVDY